MSQCEQMIEIRICTACGTPLPPDQFYRVHYGEGLARECKKCRLLREKIRYRTNREQILFKKKEKCNKTWQENPIDRLNKILESIGICWLDNLKVWHEKKFGGKKDGKVSQ